MFTTWGYLHIGWDVYTLPPMTCYDPDSDDDTVEIVRPEFDIQEGE